MRVHVWLQHPPSSSSSSLCCWTRLQSDRWSPATKSRCKMHELAAPCICRMLTAQSRIGCQTICEFKRGHTLNLVGLKSVSSTLCDVRTGLFFWESSSRAHHLEPRPRLEKRPASLILCCLFLEALDRRVLLSLNTHTRVPPVNN